MPNPKPLAERKVAQMSDVADRVAENLGLAKAQTQTVVAEVFKVIEQLLVEKARVSVLGFCSWQIKIKPEGKYKKYICAVGEDPEVWMPDRVYGTTRMSAKLMERIAKLAEDPVAFANIKEKREQQYTKDKANMARKAALRIVWRANDAARDLEAKRQLLASYGVDMDAVEPKGPVE